MSKTIHISDIRLLSNGADGGHTYVAGHCEWSGQRVRVYAFMADNAEERKLTSCATSCILEYGSYDLSNATGLSLWACRLQPDA